MSVQPAVAQPQGWANNRNLLLGLVAAVVLLGFAVLFLGAVVVYLVLNQPQAVAAAPESQQPLVEPTVFVASSPTPASQVQVVPTQTKRVLPSPTATSVVLPTFTPTPNCGRVVTAQNANLRSGPGLQYDVLMVLPAGNEVQVVGRDFTGEWWQIEDGGAGGGYVWISTTVTSGQPCGNVPVVSAPPEPTPMPPTRVPPTEVPPEPTEIVPAPMPPTYPGNIADAYAAGAGSDCDGGSEEELRAWLYAQPICASGQCDTPSNFGGIVHTPNGRTCYWWPSTSPEVLGMEGTIVVYRDEGGQIFWFRTSSYIVQDREWWWNKP